MGNNCQCAGAREELHVKTQ